MKNLKILVTGTPGTGKTTLCDKLVKSFKKVQKLKKLKMKHIQMSQMVNEKKLYQSIDDKMNTTIYSKDKVKRFLL